MDDAAKRLWTRLLLVVMILTAFWGAWVIAENGGRRGKIGFPKDAKNQAK